MKNFTITLISLEVTKQFGYLIGKELITGDIITLDGDLGAGKTTLTQSIARGLEVPEKYYITSPSFNIMHEYPGRLSLYHMDFYRLHGSDDVLSMGLEEFFYGNGVTVIEWGVKAADVIPETGLAIHMAVGDEESREVTITVKSDYWLEKIEKLMRTLPEIS